ncbi:MAG: hypothetical protein AB7O69_14150 [Burkholderiales bacterium]
MPVVRLLHACFAVICCASPLAAMSAAKTIELTQVPCQFLESEGGINRGYTSRSIRDCEAINNHSAESRAKSAKPLRLAPGKYIFRVANRNVPYELGFWLRGSSPFGRVTLPSVSGGGIHTGKSRDYEIDLKPGEYVYSCPLNNTPDYRLLVQ